MKTTAFLLPFVLRKTKKIFSIVHNYHINIYQRKGLLWGTLKSQTLLCNNNQTYFTNKFSNQLVLLHGWCFLAASDQDTSEKIFKESQTTPVCWIWMFDITKYNVMMQKTVFDVCKQRSRKVYMSIWFGCMVVFNSAINNSI